MWYAGLLMGLISSTHCAGMCGPLHAALAARQRSNRRFLLGRMSYNAGRIAMYGLLGLAFGSLGLVGRLAFSQQMVTLTAGGFMLILAAKQLWIKLPLLSRLSAHRGISALKERFFQSLSRQSLPGQAITGALNGLLPCGILGLALAASVAMPSTWESMAFMIAFGIGTLPLLLTIGLAGERISSLVRRVPQLEYALPILIGAMLIFRGLPAHTTDKPCHTNAQTGLLHAQTGPGMACKPR